MNTVAFVNRRIARRPSLSSQVYDAVCESLTSGALMPGDRVVIEHLALQLGVSPTPAREAVARLVQDGLLTDDGSGKLQVVPLTREYVLDTLAVRCVLEGLSAELAATRISRDTLRELRELLGEEAVYLARGAVSRYQQTDKRMHALICEVAGNAVLTRELLTIETHVDFIRAYAQRASGEHLHHSHDEHMRVLAALEARDPVAARESMELHYRSTSHRIAQLIPFEAGGPAGDRRRVELEEEACPA